MTASTAVRFSEPEGPSAAVYITIYKSIPNLYTFPVLSCLPDVHAPQVTISNELPVLTPALHSETPCYTSPPSDEST